MSRKYKVAEHPALSEKSTRHSTAIFLALVFWAATQSLLIGQEPANPNSQPNIDLTGIKCIVSGVKNADPDYGVKFKDGMVFFSNQQAANLFRAVTSKKRVRASLIEPHANRLIVKANHQLALTQQYIQTCCPITGEPINRKTQVRLGGVDVAFSNQFAADAFGDQAALIRRAPLVFGDSNFDQAFVAAQASTAIMAKRGTDIKKK